MITPLASRRGLITSLARGIQRESAAASWWLSGGISAANCAVAYQAKGVADYATSLVNLNNPGTNNAVEIDAPDWDATNGWKFNGTSDYLDTGLAPSAGWSMICRFSNLPLAQRGLCGTDSKPRFYLRPYHLFNQRVYAYGDSAIVVTSSPLETSGVMCMVGGVAGYFDGVNEGSIAFTFSSTTNHVFIGRGYGSLFGGYIQAFGLYNTQISAEQVAALTTAMNAL